MVPYWRLKYLLIGCLIEVIRTKFALDLKDGHVNDNLISLLYICVNVLYFLFTFNQKGYYLEVKFDSLSDIPLRYLCIIISRNVRN